jgi:hypothetical protein
MTLERKTYQRCITYQNDHLKISTVTIEGVSEPTILKSLACREALALASDLNLYRFKVATDCLEMANCFRSQKKDNGKFSFII